MKKEIEIKIHLDEMNLNILKNWLSGNAIYQGLENQKDYYFDDPQNTSMIIHESGYRYALKYLRVRITQNAHFICYKDWNISKENETLYCHELEVQVDNGYQIIDILKLLGFNDVTSLIKCREIYNYKEFEIVIDTVSELGTFVEIEVKKREFQDPKSEYEKLKKLIQFIGIENYKIQKQGFIIMLWNPNFDFVNCY